ncbi:3',5'-cyclic-AMP phosphodiesterase [Xenorhabdus budapestensis]|uniref:3',5'-cyclic adenosine monophosphate phosphodiesterase CpdA n=1 Tax=Xenorhabdus budapestensis TaxID=290110 RepID=A0A2D0J3M2_XENBU|nr:3',5'-cyclic-AMP phosphodiesterase [Xenorhabdus budapestensis]PHM28996.1 cyclic 3',5'-adenosine monophosphate phosphodiesterase [Xenorhabdus budapestensis]QTL39483.1 3',5'-cyclic-AMP phosphodiesterase [Xenorhabdus budapestensis]
MERLLEIPVAKGATARILQITDMHLFANKGNSLLGVNTYCSYHAVLDAILEQNLDIDLVVATGDLVQDQTIGAYQHFVEGVARLSAPCVWLPGNHDYQPAMVDVLAAAGLPLSKQIFIGQHWQLIMLDSQVQGVPYGELTDYQLEWMTKCLDEHSDRYAIVMLHHHPVPSGCTWLDQHCLRNAPALAEFLKDKPQVKTMLCGHIHQELDDMWNGIRVMATPSTCVQFKPHCTNFMLDTVAPGWRYLELSVTGEGEAKLQTQLHRLKSNEFCPDLDSDGY